MGPAAFAGSDLVAGGPSTRCARRLALASGAAAAAMLAVPAIAVAATDHPIMLGPEGPVLVAQGAETAIFAEPGPDKAHTHALALTELISVAVFVLGGTVWLASRRGLCAIEACSGKRRGADGGETPRGAQPFVIHSRACNGFLEVQLAVAGALWAAQAALELAGVAPYIYNIRCGGCDLPDPPSLSDLQRLAAPAADPAPWVAGVGRRLAYTVTAMMLASVILLGSAAATSARSPTVINFMVAMHVGILGGALGDAVAPENRGVGVALHVMAAMAWVLILIKLVAATLSAALAPPPSAPPDPDDRDHRVRPSTRRFSDRVARLHRQLRQLCMSVLGLMFAMTAVSAVHALVWQEPEADPVLPLTRFLLSMIALLLCYVDLLRLQRGVDAAIAQRTADRQMERITTQQRCAAMSPPVRSQMVLIPFTSSPLTLSLPSRQRTSQRTYVIRRMVQYIAHEMHPALAGSHSLLASALRSLQHLYGATDQSSDQSSPTATALGSAQRRRTRELLIGAIDDIAMSAFSVQALRKPLKAITDDTGAVRERIHLSSRPFAPSVVLPAAASAGSEQAALARVRVRVRRQGLLAQRIDSGSASVAAAALRRALWRAQARGLYSAHVIVGDSERIAQGTRAVVRAAVSCALPESTVVVRLHTEPLKSPTLPAHAHPPRLSLQPSVHSLSEWRRRGSGGTMHRVVPSEPDVIDVVPPGERVRVTVEVLLVGDASELDITIRDVHASGVLREEVQAPTAPNGGIGQSLSERLARWDLDDTRGGGLHARRESHPVGDDAQTPLIPGLAGSGLGSGEGDSSAHELARVAVAAVIVNEMGGTLECERISPLASAEPAASGPSWRIRLILALPAASPTAAADVASLVRGPGADTPSLWQAAHMARAALESPTDPVGDAGVPQVSGEGFVVADESKDEDEEDEDDKVDEDEVARIDEAASL